MTRPECPTCGNSVTVQVAAYGEFFATRQRAMPIRSRAVVFLDMHPDDALIFDFAGVQAVTGGFADELVASLAGAYPGRVRVVGANADVAATIALALTRRGTTADVQTITEPEETP